ncbi:FAD-binding oxidoreductase [Streptomyces lydicamycinicus]|uniref:FAD-binding oxidoreductase n=1 Tax=Streptomyces lydicamycinicus TaxID=1546107 RepID=UPI003D800A6C
MVTMARDPLFHASGTGTGAHGGEGSSPGTGGRTATVRNNVDWDGLRRRLEGVLLRPGDAGFDSARKLFNPLNDDRVPAAVAQCASVADVREAVLAAAHRVPLAARSGGHSYVGYSAPPGGLTIDLRRLSTVRVRPDGTATIGAGATLGGHLHRTRKGQPLYARRLLFHRRHLRGGPGWRNRCAATQVRAHL